MTSLTETLATASAQLQNARALIAQGDTDTTGTLSYYKKAADTAYTASLLAKNVTDILIQTTANESGFSQTVDSLVNDASGYDSAANNAVTKSEARQEAVSAVNSADTAIIYATEANNLYVQPPTISIGAFAALAILAGSITWYAVKQFKQPSIAYQKPVRSHRITS